MGRGREATLCAKCSQDSPDPIGAACLQRDRRLWVSQWLWVSVRLSALLNSTSGRMQLKRLASGGNSLPRTHWRYLSVFEHDRARQAKTTICHFTSNMELY